MYSSEDWFLFSRASFLRFFSSLSLFLSLSSPHPCSCPWGHLLSPWLVGLPILGREGRMVVLSLVLGLSEQDDFANIPDLQNPGTQQNQNAQGDKRYEHGRGLRQRQQQQRRRHGEATCLSQLRLLDEVVVSSADAGVGEALQLVFCPLTTCVVSRGSMKGPSWDHSGSSLLPSMLALVWSKPSLLGPSPCLPPSAAPPSFISAPLPNPEIPVSLVVGE